MLLKLRRRLAVDDLPYGVSHVAFVLQQRVELRSLAGVVTERHEPTVRLSRPTTHLDQRPHTVRSVQLNHQITDRQIHTLLRH